MRIYQIMWPLVMKELQRMSLTQSSIAEVHSAPSRASSAAPALSGPSQISMSKGEAGVETAPVSTQAATSKESSTVTSRVASTDALSSPVSPLPQKQISSEESQLAKMYNIPPPKEEKRAIWKPALTVTQIDDYEFVLGDVDTTFRMTSHEMRSVLLRMDELHLVLLHVSCGHQHCGVCGVLVPLTPDTAANHSKNKCAINRAWVIKQEIIDGVVYLPMNGVLVTYLGFKYLFPIMTKVQADSFLFNWSKFTTALQSLAAPIPPVVQVKFEKEGMTLTDHNVLMQFVVDARSYTGLITYESEFTACLPLFNMKKEDVAKLFLLYAGFHFTKNELNN
jgi:hypothetical protein